VLKHLNLAQNRILSFNFELYFPSSKNSGTSEPTCELASLNVSSNRLDSLDAESVRWLKHTAAVTDLSGNPWKCECSALGEAWRELGNNRTVICASPEDRRGRTWDVIEEDSCHDRFNSVEPTAKDNQNVLSDAKANITTDTGPPLVSTLIVVNGVLVVCTFVGGGFIAVQILKKLRKGSELPEHNEVSVALTETDPSVLVSSRLSLRSTYSTGHIYETIE
jgi:hypothetical protein